MQFFLANLFIERLAGLDQWVRLPEPEEATSENTTSSDDQLSTTAA